MEQGDDNEVVRSAGEIIAAAFPMAERMRLRRRRLILALGDLGLLELVGGQGFVSIGEGTLEFGDLDDRRSDGLVRRLECLAAAIPPVKPYPGDHQARLGN
jgi:hypothetical protein